MIFMYSHNILTGTFSLRNILRSILLYEAVALLQTFPGSMFTFPTHYVRILSSLVQSTRTGVARKPKNIVKQKYRVVLRKFSFISCRL